MQFFRSVSAPRWLEDRRFEWTVLIAPGRLWMTALHPVRAPVPVRTVVGSFSGPGCSRPAGSAAEDARQQLTQRGRGAECKPWEPRSWSYKGLCRPCRLTPSCPNSTCWYWPPPILPIWLEHYKKKARRRERAQNKQRRYTHWKVMATCTQWRSVA